MALGRFLFKVFKRTGGSTSVSVSGTTSQALSTTLTGISAQLIASSGNIEQDGMTFSLTDTSLAGSWSCSVRVTNANGGTSNYQITFTLTGAAWVGGLSAIAGPTMGITTATFGYTLTGSATYAQVAINELGNIYNLDNLTKVVTVLQPNSIYSFYLRATDGANFSDWYPVRYGTTLDDNPTPPIPVTQSLAAVTVSDGIHTNCSLNRTTAGVYPQTAFAKGDASRGNNYLNTTWDTTGWVMGQFEPLAKVGLRTIRSAGGASSAASHQAVQVPKKLYYDCYGTRFSYTMSQYTAAQMSTALANGAASSDVGSVSVEAAVDRIVNTQAECVRSLQGMNEPNWSADPHYAASAAWPGGWKTIVMDHAYVLGTKVAAVRSSFPSDFTLGAWSVWGRRLLAIRQFLYAGYTSVGSYPYTLTGTWSPFTSITLGKQWVRDCLPLYDWLNIHYYNGGRRPLIGGDANDNASSSQEGSNTEIALEEVFGHHRELAQNDSDFPMWMTENGWELGGGDVPIGGRTVYSSRLLTEHARIKYYQRMWFENMKFGLVSTNAFEFFDNAISVPTSNVSGNGNVYGLVTFSWSGGVCTFVRRKFWYMMWTTLAPMFDGNTSTGAEAATARTFTPAPLAFTLGNQVGGAVNGNVKSLLFQKSNGKWMLALWLDTESWRRSGQAPNDTYSAAYNETFQSTPVRITVESSRSMRSTRPYVDAIASTAATTWSGTTVGTTFDITVHDDVSYVEIT
jgi:hypothetical protein